METYKTKHKPVLDYLLQQTSHGECPYINISIYGMNITGLLDSGANKIFINEQLANILMNLGIQLNVVDNSSCTIANNQELNCVGYLTIPIKLETQVHLFDVFVIPELRHELVLGTIFWIKMGIVPDLRNGSWHFATCEEIKNTLFCNSIQTADDLTLGQRNKLETIITDYFESIKNTKLGCTNIIEHTIETNSPPIKSKYYPVSPFMQKKIDEELEKMLELGVLERSTSGWSSPILMVPKKDSTYRFCVDFRKLNSVSEKWAYPLPIMSDILDKLGNAKYITTLDIQSAYWQIKLSDSSKKYTAFTVPNRGLFHFNRMPFGLSNAPATFQFLVDRLFGDLEFVFKYLDDIVIVTPDYDTHVKVLQEVLTRLTNANLTLNKDKCYFCKSELKFLGYVINRQGLLVDPEKVSAIVQLPRPKTVKEVRRLIGMIMWYRKYIANLSAIIEPLTNLTRKNVKFAWTTDCEQAFIKVKNALITAPILSCPNFNHEFILQCDASTEGLGCILSQFYDGREHVICYLSRTLTRSERNYSATELECLCVIWSIEKLRCYLEGTHFTVITDHHSLIWLLHNQRSGNGKICRWQLRLQQYDYTIVHRPGKYNIVADCLSRAVPENDEISNITITSDSVDKWYASLQSKIRKNPLNFPSFRISNDGSIYKHQGNNFSNTTNWKLVIPKYKRKEILKTHHDNPLTGAHFGIFKTYHRIFAKYYWPGMKSDIIRYINKCRICCSQKPEQKLKAGQMDTKLINVVRCWQYIAIDLMGPLPRSSKGNQYIFVVCDHFSKMTLIFALRKATTTSIIKLLEEHVFHLFGVPEFLKCDNGVQFKSRDFKKLLQDYNIKPLYNPLYHPAPNFSERANRVIKTMISSYVGDNHKTWDSHLSKLACAYRTAKHEVTNQSPYFVNFGCEMITNGRDYLLEREKLDSIHEGNDDVQKDNSLRLQKLAEIRKLVKERLEKSHEKSRHEYNLRHRPVQYKIGDLVWKKEHSLSSSAKEYAAKLGVRYTGPFRIKTKLGISVYEIEDDLGTSKGTWHVSHLKPHKDIDSDV